MKVVKVKVVMVMKVVKVVKEGRITVVPPADRDRGSSTDTEVGAVRMPEEKTGGADKD